jgi:hypothetical protein
MSYINNYPITYSNVPLPEIRSSNNQGNPEIESLNNTQDLQYQFNQSNLHISALEEKLRIARQALLTMESDRANAIYYSNYLLIEVRKKDAQIKQIVQSEGNKIQLLANKEFELTNQIFKLETENRNKDYYIQILQTSLRQQQAYFDSQTKTQIYPSTQPPPSPFDLPQNSSIVSEKGQNERREKTTPVTKKQKK